MGRRAPLFFAVPIFMLTASSARAEPPPAELLAKLADYARHFEQQRTHETFAVQGRLDELDGDGKPDGKKELWGHLDSNGLDVHFRVIRYLEDGEDKTDDAREKARESDEKNKKKKKDGKELKMPPLPSTVTLETAGPSGVAAPNSTVKWT